MPTKHDKARLIAPHFHNLLQVQIEEVNLDTDVLGTFSGEIERVGNSLETAIKKAKLGIEATGNPLAIASEGSITADPFVPFITADIETLVFIDEELEITVYETVISNEIFAATTTTLKNNLDEFLKRADFPNHALIVKPNSGAGAIKGIREIRELEKAITDARDQSSDGEAIIESDLRAMCSPSRQKNISATALKLVQRLSRTCPECQTPGWGLTSYTRGVECSECGDFSIDAIKQEVIGCVKCEYTAPGAVINLTLDPAQCMSCNP
jgi:ribosomal protein S27AE